MKTKKKFYSPIDLSGKKVTTEEYIEDCIVKAKEYGCPVNIARSLALYAAEGRRPGGFGTAVLQNDYWRAARRADQENFEKLGQIMMFVVNCLPSSCWGSEQEVKEWKGLAIDERTND